jgi:hypothetical protein
MASTIIMSPATLAKYAGLLESGHADIGVPVESYVAPAGPNLASFSSSLEASLPQQADTIIAQLHGSHTETHILSLVPSTCRRLIVLIHRPEEIHLRLQRGEYEEAVRTILEVSGDDARVKLVVLGAAGLKFFPSAVVIPHGFSAVSETAAAAPPFASSVSVVGSITTWGDMRWLRDLIELHAAMRACDSKHSSRVLFVASGSFVPYTNPDGVLVDELQSLVESGSVEVFDSSKISDASVFDQAAFRSHLYAESGNGAKVCIILPDAGIPKSIASSLIDFNTQLYRELLSDFLPKVEYSGTLHENPGGSVPVVFDSPSMDDVSSEGLYLLRVPSPSKNSVVQVSALATVCEAIVDLMANGERFAAALKGNNEAGKETGFDKIAGMYQGLRLG